MKSVDTGYLEAGGNDRTVNRDILDILPDLSSPHPGQAHPHGSPSEPNADHGRMSARQTQRARTHCLMHLVRETGDITHAT